ncbi:hypothetical protein R5W23_002138 [Gemmata sp. JC673]|uniref:Uncharacterized protein n=1 Tax=Gemmata algarum TaxID=2975278 RepID=A0ABU5F080_9BACT|nr:hypothetical protein [Gemmata algarum]MDY3560889.1 hypothetical protein [Gemmata algarum]
MRSMGAVAVCVALLTPWRLCAAPAPPGGAPKPLTADVVAAWQKAGAEVG